MTPWPRTTGLLRATALAAATFVDLTLAQLTPTQNSHPVDAGATDEIPPRFVAGKSFTSPRGQSYDVNPCAQESGRLDVSVKTLLGVPLICPGCTLASSI